MKTRRWLLIIALLIENIGCAKDLTKNRIVNKMSDDEAQICLCNIEAKKGDKISLYRYSNAARGGRKKQILGFAEITEINGKCAIIKVNKNVPFNNGTLIEVAQKN